MCPVQNTLKTFFTPLFLCYPTPIHQHMLSVVSTNHARNLATVDHPDPSDHGLSPAWCSAVLTALPVFTLVLYMSSSQQLERSLYNDSDDVVPLFKTLQRFPVALEVKANVLKKHQEDPTASGPRTRLCSLPIDTSHGSHCSSCTCSFLFI